VRLFEILRSHATGVLAQNDTFRLSHSERGGGHLLLGPFCSYISQGLKFFHGDIVPAFYLFTPYFQFGLIKQHF